MYRIVNNITNFFKKHNKIPYHLQWENRDFVAKLPTLKLINNKTLVKYSEISKTSVPYNKQWESRDFYKKYEK